jgi:2-polyprenyl-3-methyl-5-hydroxy-6-metoxy-1,4-benzoquinol methylase
MSLHSGERQVAETVQGIRRDHVARYEWAARTFGKKGCEIRDLGCGVGYGSSILASSGANVLGIDRDPEAIAYAYKHYSSANCFFLRGDVEKLFRVQSDVAVAFEIVEHLDAPERMLSALTETKRLIASVPNEIVFPYDSLTERGKTFHRRHYTPEEFAKLLHSCGWSVLHWLTQEGPESEIETGMSGRTIIANCVRARATA